MYVDSGGWIALFSRRDANHREAKALFHEAARRRHELFTSNLVLAEVHRFILFRAGIAPAVAALERIGRAERLSVEFVTRAVHDAAIAWLRRFADQPFTYTNATGFAVMRSRGSRQAITFDRHFEVAGFERWRPAAAGIRPLSPGRTGSSAPR
ncbi:MAG: type II toxin-antitoxin system VapC family toxin, partial [Candidatus Binatia bacterium]